MNKELFNYHLRVSARARHVRLRVTVRHGLEVVIPRGYDAAKVPALLEKKKTWVRAALDRADSQRKFFEPEPAWRLPHTITLPALGMTWQVHGTENKNNRLTVREQAGKLFFSGAIENEKLCRTALHRWLVRKTREYIVPRLHQLSVEKGLRYHRSFVRRQRTRWASCSKHRSISLNVKLLFLPPELTDYVLIHELCHLVEMNHSKNFWRVVQKHCPEYSKLDASLRDMWKRIPRWAS
mgnify:CR=1 FL=1